MSEKKDSSKLTESRGYNPFEVMVKLKIFKEYTDHTTNDDAVHSVLGHDLDKFELTQEFRDFVYNNTDDFSTADNNAYTPYCICRYIIEECGMKVGHEYKQDKSVTEEQILEFFRILMLYFLLHSTDYQTIKSTMEYGEEALRDHINYEITGIVYDILFEEYNRRGVF